MTTISVRASTTHLAVDARTADQAGAEHVVHLLDDLLPATHPTYVASTHLVAGPTPHTAVVASWTSTDPLGGPPEEVVEDLATRLGRHLPEAGLVLTASSGTASRGPEELVSSALGALAEHRARSAGRLARYRGRAAIERLCTVSEVLTQSAVDSVDVLAGTVLEAESMLDLREWARPTWRNGTTVLLVQPGRTGLVPFESRHQIACCSDH